MIRVKKLEFEQQDWDRRVYIAKPVAEWMYIVQSYEPKYPTTVWQWRTSDTLKLSDDVGSYEAAVAACQAHYDAMILTQIEVEPLAFAVQHEYDDVK